VVVAVVQWLLTRRRDIAYGPFLCFTTLLVIMNWSSVWFNHCRLLFSLGWIILAVVGVCLLVMGAMLMVWRWIAS
jgi:leader peptidase (prepilin peptidase) / N-methyltransferase